MPLYDYSCPCGCIAELITTMDEIPDCPECGKKMKREVRRKIFSRIMPPEKDAARKMKRVD